MNVVCEPHQRMMMGFIRYARNFVLSILRSLRAPTLIIQLFLPNYSSYYCYFSLLLIILSTSLNSQFKVSKTFCKLSVADI
jgi:hypothetical protein